MDGDGRAPCIIGELSRLKPAYFSIYLHNKQKTPENRAYLFSIIKIKSIMAPHVERMVNEQKELSEKIEKLGAFISENPIFDTLAEEEQYDMHLQLQAMSMYNAVLMNRIKRATAE